MAKLRNDVLMNIKGEKQYRLKSVNAQLNRLTLERAVLITTIEVLGEIINNDQNGKKRHI